jgi:hypothetical protein
VPLGEFFPSAEDIETTVSGFPASLEARFSLGRNIHHGNFIEMEN